MKHELNRSLSDTSNHVLAYLYGLWENRTSRMYLLLAIGCLFALLILKLNKPLFFIVLFLILNILIALILKPFRTILFGIELVMFATVLTGMAYGVKAGLFMGLFASALKIIFQDGFTIIGIFVVPSYTLMGLIAPFLASANVTHVGILLTVIHAVLVSVIIFIMLGGEVSRIAIYLITYIPYNFFLFAYIAPTVFKVMTQG